MSNQAVSNWTLEECATYVADCNEMYGELRAEAGMGAMSMGYGVEGAYDAANSVGGPESDPLYVAALARVEEDIRTRGPVRPPEDTSDDIPF